MNAERTEAGLKCPNCGATVWTIDETRKQSDAVRRNRVCRKCGERVITQETILRSAPKRFYLKKCDRFTTGSDSSANTSDAL